MARLIGPRLPSGRFTAMRKPRAKKMVPSKSLSKNQKKAVKNIVMAQAETKRVAYYQTWRDGSTPVTAPDIGAQGAMGWARQNNIITNNFTDILQLIPMVTKGDDDWNRDGTKISVNGLNVKGEIRVRNERTYPALASTNIDVYVYIVQHVSLKDYTNLYAQNDFSQFLSNSNGSTRAFLANAQDPLDPVTKQYYKLCLKKKVTLRYAGGITYDGTPTGAVSVANAHTWKGSYSLNLTKFLPKKLLYPEATVATPYAEDTPTNSSLFMCMGFVDWQVDPHTSVNPPPTNAWLEQTYVSHLTFKDP